MQVSVRGFLYARFIAIVAWVLLLAAGYLAYRTLAPHIASDWLRWFVSLATLAGSIWLGFLIQRRALLWLDPDGELRRQVQEESEAARQER